MVKRIGLLVFVFALSLDISAQKERNYTEKWEYIGEDETLGFMLRYELKENKVGKKELHIKFKNKSKKHLALETKFGFYSNGILEETTEINSCLHKSELNNWFRRIYLIESDALNANDIEIKILEFKHTIIDECRETDR